MGIQRRVGGDGERSAARDVVSTRSVIGGVPARTRVVRLHETAAVSRYRHGRARSVVRCIRRNSTAGIAVAIIGHIKFRRGFSGHVYLRDITRLGRYG